MAEYLQITNIEYPSQAPAGSTVDFKVHVKNIWTSGISSRVTAFANSGTVNIAAGQTHIFDLPFTMPSTGVDIGVTTWWLGSDLSWHNDDYQIVHIDENPGLPQGNVEIIAQSVPASVAQGSPATVSITVRNNYTVAKIVTASTSHVQSNVAMSPSSVLLQPNVTQQFTSTFTMPSVDVPVSMGVFADGVIEDMAAPAVIERTPASVTYDGTMERMALDFGSADLRDIPLVNVPHNSNLLFKVIARNQMSTSQRMGIEWEIRNPQGNIVESHSNDWSTVSANDTHQFIGGRFNYDNVGGWSINVRLYMNETTKALVSFYVGALCSVIQTTEDPIYSGAITNVEQQSGSDSNDFGILVSFNASIINWWDAFGGWETRVTGYISGLEESDNQNHAGMEGDRDDQPLNFGAVAPGNYQLQVKLEARASILHSWVVLDTKSYNMEVFQASGSGEQSGLVIQASSIKIDGWGTSESNLTTSPLEIQPGQILYVKYSYRYTATSTFQHETWLSVSIDPFRDKTLKPIDHLEQSASLKLYENTIAIPISESDPKLGNDTYDLWLEVLGYGSDKQDNVIIISGMPAGIGDLFSTLPNMMAMMMVVMMLSLMMTFMNEEGGIFSSAEGTYKKRIEPAVKSVQQGYEKYGAPVINLFTSRKDD